MQLTTLACVHVSRNPQPHATNRMATQEATKIFSVGEDCKPGWKEATAVFNNEGNPPGHLFFAIDCAVADRPALAVAYHSLFY